jgi:DNA-binding SARP family transcriptional activator/tetratricopeptide (TPR) repeat protein
MYRQSFGFARIGLQESDKPVRVNVHTRDCDVMDWSTVATTRGYDQDAVPTAVVAARQTAAVLTGADVTGRDVTGADVPGADVPGADVPGPDVTGRDVTGADISAAGVTGERNGLWLRVLGPLAGWRDGASLRLGPPRQRAVLGLLALNAGTSVHRDALVDALWGDDPPTSAINLVQAHVGRLRRVLDGPRLPRDTAGVLVSAGTSYRLQVDPDQLDWLAFQDHVGRAAAACSSGDERAGCELYERALRLWHGEPLTDIDTVRDRPEARMVSRAWAAAVADYAQAGITTGSTQRVLPFLWALTERDALNEEAHALLMVALAGAGQQAVALRVFDDIRYRLDAHLGIRPGRELQEAQLRILRQEIPTLGLRPGPTADTVTVARQLPAGTRHFVGRIDEMAILTDLVDAMSTPVDGTTNLVDAGSDLDRRTTTLEGMKGPTAASVATVVIAAIDGPAGIGKTALAVHWAHTVADRFPDGQLYVDLRGFDAAGPPVPTAEAIRGFLQMLRVPVEAIPVSIDAQVGLYRSLLAGRRILVVLDNASDSAQVRALIPASPTCMVLVTSRRQLTGLVAVEGAHSITLKLFDAEDAGRLAASRLGAARVGAEPQAVDELIELCAGLPLALSIAAARAAGHPDFPLAALVDHLRDARSRLDTLSANDPAGDLRAVFASSYQHLRPDCGRLFRLLGLHPGPDISLRAAASLAGTSPEHTRRHLDELTRAHLLTERVPGRYGLHDLLRGYAAELAHACDGVTERQAATRRILDHYLHTAASAALVLEPHRGSITLAASAPGVLAETMTEREPAASWFTAEHSVLLASIRHAAEAGHDTHTWQLAWALATFLYWQGYWHDLVITQQTALDASRRATDRPAQAIARRLLGRAHTRLGHLDEARRQFSAALELFAALGDRDGQARTHHDLALVYERQECFHEALDHAEHALDLHYGTGHRVWQARALNAVGWYSALLHDFQRALTCCQQALALHQELGDPPAEAHTWHSLGYAHHHLGNHGLAVACYQHALDLHLGFGDRYHEGETLVRLGDTYGAAGNIAAARTAWQRAEDILSGLGHSDTDRVRARLVDLGRGE